MKINDNNDLLKKFVDLDSMISCCDYFDFIKFGLDNNKPGILSIIESFCYDDFRNDLVIQQFGITKKKYNEDNGIVSNTEIDNGQNS